MNQFSGSYFIAKVKFAYFKLLLEHSLITSNQIKRPAINDVRYNSSAGNGFKAANTRPS